MKKEDFELVISSLDKRIEECALHFRNVKSTKDLNKLTIEEAQELREFCLKEHEEMTKIAMVDLYHMIGMGNLSSVQMIKFTSKMREYLSFRSDVKSIAQGLESLFELPKIPKKTRFKLLALCNLTLYSDFTDEAGCVEDTSSVRDYVNKVEQLRGPLPFNKISKDEIQIPECRLAEFVQLCPSLGMNGGSLNNFKQKIDAGKSYMGVSWRKVDDQIIGKVTTQSILHKIDMIIG